MHHAAEFRCPMGYGDGERCEGEYTDVDAGDIGTGEDSEGCRVVHELGEEHEEVGLVMLED